VSNASGSTPPGSPIAPPDAPRTGGGAPILLRAFFVVAVLFTLIGLTESGFVVYDLFTGTLSAQRAPDLSFGIRSWTVHHALRPGYSNPNVRINSFGLRSPEVAVPKPVGTFRILLLGDSFTFGFQAQEDEVFARRLEANLRREYGSPSIEVVNAGVLSYCPLLEYLQYRDSLHILEPDLVVLNFDMSDVQDHLAYSRNLVSSTDGKPLYVTEPSLGKGPSRMPGLLSFEWFGRHMTALRQRLESSASGVPFERDTDRYLWTLDNGPDWDHEAQLAMAPIADLADLLHHFNIPLVLATYPQPWQVAKDASPSTSVRTQYGIGVNTVHLNDRPFRKLEKFAADHDLPFVNATSDFRRDSQPASLFLTFDFHFSGRGHELYAEVLARYFGERALIKPRLDAHAAQMARQ
jgi:hypothetical protein